jgi:hypothetical protein
VLMPILARPVAAVVAAVAVVATAAVVAVVAVELPREINNCLH